ncbi:hypothetical protein [Sphingomonas suaedae]|uniref:hypothetical protein n=1 Tax=Sphingomonas suaedae TaxID=2599297 RepID=UPI0016443702|nr:hypothetical protein [Sphingomonas suaedae]
MERRLRMMIAGSIAVWVPVASAAEASPILVDMGKVYRLKVQPAGDAPSPTEVHAR